MSEDCIPLLWIPQYQSPLCHVRHQGNSLKSHAYAFCGTKFLLLTTNTSKLLARSQPPLVDPQTRRDSFDHEGAACSLFTFPFFICLNNICVRFVQNLFYWLIRCSSSINGWLCACGYETTVTTGRDIIHSGAHRVKRGQHTGSFASYFFIHPASQSVDQVSFLWFTLLRRGKKRATIQSNG